MIYLFIAHIGPQYSSCCSFILIGMHSHQQVVASATYFNWNPSQMIDIVGDLCLKIKIVKFFNWISFIISPNSFEGCLSKTYITAEKYSNIQNKSNASSLLFMLKENSAMPVSGLAFAFPRCKA